MFTSSLSRAGAVVILLGLLFGFLIWFGSLPPAPDAGAFPGTPELTQDYDRYVDDRVIVSGVVTSSDPVTIVATDDTRNTLQLTITGLATPVEEGETISVFGIAREGKTIDAIRMVKYQNRGLWYAYSVSLLAGLWTLGRLVRDWRVDREHWGLTPRAQLLDLHTAFRRWVSRTKHSDA